eukprot:CAMPEP_0177679588 /NCGR_PEP_ID=MMETSP0447-20121125/29686_1 /TAXON_ID=0 /ORGANISM="Stygamoeba regulata, Strain BSH-02190019" /LENGTH=324 /DNA_ID=CAMNT_0019188795 /DNA_START=103 /DNA_END=1077 /DNA_ORIENTATION=-
MSFADGGKRDRSVGPDGPLIGGFTQSGRQDRSGYGYEPSSRGAAPVESSGERAEYARVRGLLAEDVKQLSYRVSQIQKLVGLIGTARDSEELRHDIEATVESTRKLARDANAQLKLLSSFCTRASGSAEIQSRKRQYDELREDFVHWLERFQTAAREAEHKERDIQKSAQARLDKQPTLYQGDLSGSDEHERTGLLASAQQQQQQQQQRDRQRAMAARQAQIELNQALIEEREMGIREIHQGVLEIDEIMSDLDIIVKEQGKLIYTIEDQIEASAVAVHEGVEKLEDAHKTQKSTRCSRCAIVVSIICLVAIIILAISLGVTFG